LDKIQYLDDKIDERLTHFQTVQMEHGMTLRNISNEVGLKKPKILAVKDGTQSMQTHNRLLKPSSADILLESELKNGEGMQQLNSNEPPGQLYVEREDGGLSIPVEHTTAAHKLLSWPSIRNLLYPREYDEDYVMKLEEQRGLIRAYGHGEGDDTSGDCTSPTLLTSSNSSSGWDDTYTHRESPSSPWTQGAHPGGFPQKLRDKGVDEFGILWADADTIRRYHRSYLEHRHKLHPFLDQGDLDKEIETFIKFHCLPKDFRTDAYWDWRHTTRRKKKKILRVFARCSERFSSYRWRWDRSDGLSHQKVNQQRCSPSLACARQHL
jgi:hypothetical protein